MNATCTRRCQFPTNDVHYTDSTVSIVVLFVRARNGRWMPRRTCWTSSSGRLWLVDCLADHCSVPSEHYHARQPTVFVLEIKFLLTSATFMVVQAVVWSPSCCLSYFLFCYLRRCCLLLGTCQKASWRSATMCCLRRTSSSYTVRWTCSAPITGAEMIIHVHCSQSFL